METGIGYGIFSDDPDIYVFLWLPKHAQFFRRKFILASSCMRSFVKIRFMIHFNTNKKQTVIESSLDETKKCVMTS